MTDLIRRDITEVLADLPRRCALHNAANGSPIMVARGERGYWNLRPGFDVDGYNERRGITAAQIEAMEIGSMFGFDAPGADPLNALK